MRILGICPNCGQRDRIQMVWQKGMPWDSKTFDQVKCESCGKTWKDWLNDLVFPEGRKGNKLIPVEINSTQWGIEMSWPDKSEIPWTSLIITVLNGALMTRFNLDVCFATEGGVCGRGLELRNCYDELGLYLEGAGMNERRRDIRNRIEKIFKFYERMLRLTFMESFKISFPYKEGVLEKEYSPGKILWLSKKEKDYRKALEILLAVLIKTKSRNFASRVMKTIGGVQRNPFSAPYLRGLSYEEIAKFFVPF